MKNILTVLLVLCSLLSYAQPTLATLDLRLQAIENSTVSITIVEHNRIVDSIANRIAFGRDTTMRKIIEGWVNDKNRQMKDTVITRISLLRTAINNLDTLRTNQIALLQTTDSNLLLNLFNQDTEVFKQIEATKLTLQNIIKALNAIQ